MNSQTVAIGFWLIMGFFFGALFGFAFGALLVGLAYDYDSRATKEPKK